MLKKCLKNRLRKKWVKKNCNRRVVTFLNPFQACSTKMHHSLIPYYMYSVYDLCDVIYD